MTSPLNELVGHVQREQLPLLNAERAEVILAWTGLAKDPSELEARARRAARQEGQKAERDAMATSEMLRRGIWSIPWDDPKRLAWDVARVAARLGTALATVHLVDMTPDYTHEDYLALVEPWNMGFPDAPLPVGPEPV